MAVNTFSGENKACVLLLLSENATGMAKTGAITGKQKETRLQIGSFCTSVIVCTQSQAVSAILDVHATAVAQVAVDNE